MLWHYCYAILKRIEIQFLCHQVMSFKVNKIERKMLVLVVIWAYHTLSFLKQKYDMNRQLYRHSKETCISKNSCVNFVFYFLVQ